MVFSPGFGDVSESEIIFLLLIQYAEMLEGITFTAFVLLIISSFNSQDVGSTQTCLTSGPTVTVE